MKFIVLFTVLVLSFFTLNSEVFSKNSDRYWAVRVHDHNLMDELSKYSNLYLDKARVQVIELKQDVTIEMIPENLRNHLAPFNPESLKAFSDDYVAPKTLNTWFLQSTANRDIEEALKTLTPESFYAQVEEITKLGKRSTDNSINYFMSKFKSLGYEPTHNFNIEAWKTGTVTPEKFVIIEGHMDTVSKTVGADDNASGAAGVLELARALKKYDSEYSILFMLTEDEELGLIGAKKYVKYLESKGLKGDVLFVVNMDMIGYNKNKVVDLETEDEFEDLAKWMAGLTTQYTTLTPNIMLDAWASDHVPFIEAGIPTLLTIEHWNTHTPCWHKTCDTLDTINAEYATEILKLNLAATIIKAKVKLF